MVTDKTREDMLDVLEQRAGDCEESFGSCAQGTLLALQEQFDLKDPLTLKAATAMPGIALRGETCGAIIGAAMALGMVFGREKPEDIKAAQHTYGAVRKLCTHFEEQFGSCNCRDIQQRLFGRSYNLANPKDQEEFAKSDAGKKCRIPVGKAARFAGELIVDGRN